MEGKAVEELVKTIKERGLGVAKICHDNDAGTSNQFAEYFGPGKQDPPVINQQGFSSPEDAKGRLKEMIKYLQMSAIA